MRAKAGLKGFIKDACANWITHHDRDGECVFKGECLVMQGEPCGYFEKAVLGPANYRYRLPGWDYPKLFDEYCAVNPHYLAKQAKQRRCECGRPLEPNKRYCPECRRKRRLVAYRTKAKNGTKRRATVN